MLKRKEINILHLNFRAGSLIFAFRFMSVSFDHKNMIKYNIDYVII